MDYFCPVVKTHASNMDGKKKKKSHEITNKNISPGKQKFLPPRQL
jgi:hypothetical protein